MGTFFFIVVEIDLLGLQVGGMVAAQQGRRAHGRCWGLADARPEAQPHLLLGDNLPTVLIPSLLLRERWRFDKPSPETQQSFRKNKIIIRSTSFSESSITFFLLFNSTIKPRMGIIYKLEETQLLKGNTFFIIHVTHNFFDLLLDFEIITQQCGNPRQKKKKRKEDSELQTYVSNMELRCFPDRSLNL